MNAKERFYSGLAKETLGKITSNKDNWTSFLVTVSRNYEFTYPEQVMIYAQRPNATFCKPYDEWNDENYRRYVRRGSTGIALFVTNREKPYLRYVFDVADTGVRRSSPELKPWEVTEENRVYVMGAMERTFGITADGLLEAQLEEIALSLSAEYWDDYKKPILDIVANSFLEEYDELNIEVAFKRAVANSVAFIACKGVCPYFCFWGCKMDRAFMDEYYDKMRADDIEELSSQRNEDYSDRADDYKAAKQALLEGLGLSHLFSGNRKLTPEEKELWLLFDRVYVTELLARDEFAKGAYMLGAEDRETMLR